MQVITKNNLQEMLKSEAVQSKLRPDIKEVFDKVKGYLDCYDDWKNLDCVAIYDVSHSEYNFDSFDSYNKVMEDRENNIQMYDAVRATNNGHTNMYLLIITEIEMPDNKRALRFKTYSKDKTLKKFVDSMKQSDTVSIYCDETEEFDILTTYYESSASCMVRLFAKQKAEPVTEKNEEAHRIAEFDEWDIKESSIFSEPPLK